MIIHTGVSRSQFFGVPFWQRDPSQGTPKTKNSTDLGQFLGLRDPNSLPKNNINNKMSHFSPARGAQIDLDVDEPLNPKKQTGFSPQKSSKKMTEVDIFGVEDAF